MKLGVLSNVFCRYPIEKAFVEASKCGYDGIELWGARPHAYPFDMNAEKIEKINKLKETYKLTICCYTPELLAYPYNIVSQNKKEREETIEYIKLSLEIAKEIKSPRVMVTVQHSGYETNQEKNWDILISNIQELTQHAEKLGVDIVLEPLSLYEGNMVYRSDDVLKVLESVESPNLKAMLDLVSPITADEPMFEYFEKIKEKLVYLHIIDGNENSEDHLMFGEGIIPFEAFFANLKNYNYNGYLTVELGSAYIADPAIYIYQAMHKIKEYIDD